MLNEDSVGPNVSTDQKHFFESDAMIQKRQEREMKSKATKNAGTPLKVSSKVLCMALFEDYLYVGESGFIVRQIHIPDWTSKKIWKGHQGPITSLIVYKNPITNEVEFLSGSWDKTIRKYNVKSKDVQQIWKEHNDFVKALVLAPLKSIVVSGSSDKTLKWWDLQSGTLIRSVLAHNSGVESLVVDKEETFVLSGSSDSTIKQFDLNTGQLMRVFQGHDTSVYSLFIFNDALYSASADKSVKAWDLETGQHASTLSHPDWVKKLTFFERHLVTCGRDEKIYVWNPDTEKIVTVLEGHFDQIDCLLSYPPYLISGSIDGTVRKWDLSSLVGGKVEDVPKPEESLIQQQEDEELDEFMKELDNEGE